MLQLVPDTMQLWGLQGETIQQTPEALKCIVEEYNDIFTEPIELPPPRGNFDHRIPLKAGTTPINLGPYRYPLKHKDVIESLVNDMQEKGIIQVNSSSFASPVVLVEKKDGSWRLCVDYRELNKNIVKDKFPITIIEDFLDELTGSRIYSKID